MRYRKVNDRGFIYVLIAIACVVLLFVGVSKVKDYLHEDNIIGNSTEKDTIDIEELAVTAFNYNDNSIGESQENELDTKKDELKANNFNSSNFFLKILINSNVYMKAVLATEGQSQAQLGLGRTFFDLILKDLEPKKYLQTQLPAIFSFIETTEVSSSNFEIIGKGNQEDEDIPVLEDILFVEAPEEAEEDLHIPEIPNSIKEGSENTIEKPKKIKLDDKNPSIMIYHTHGTEAYLPIKENNAHTGKRQYNVITIGEIIGSILKEKGHRLKHIDIYHDIPSYAESYTRSLTTLKETIKKEESIKVIFDVHRDGVEEDASYYERAKEQSKITIDGSDVATFFMVVGPENPNKDKLLEFAYYIKTVSDQLYPGLCLGVKVKPYGKFNQYVSDYYALIEVGSNLNTMKEAEESAKRVGEILHEVIEGIKE